MLNRFSLKSLILSVAISLICAANTSAQALGGGLDKVSITINYLTVSEAFAVLEGQTGYSFHYGAAGIDANKVVSVSAKDETIEQIVSKMLPGYTAQVDGMSVSIVKAAQSSSTGKWKKAGQGKPIKVTGRVMDALDGFELIAAGIQIKGDGGRGTVTDINGNFVIDAHTEDILVFNYVGYKNVEVPVDGRASINVSMELDTEVLEQTTVVGYGTQKKISVIGAQQNITSEELKAPVANLTQSIAGRVAGVVSMQRSGEPGYDDATIYIRGISTLTASMSAPLTIVDGVPRSISQIDPEDIESFTVLKDASATAIYGVRGANGVIIVNTKSGKTGKPKFDVRYTEGITQFTQLPSFVDAPTYMRLANEALETRGETRRYSDIEIEKTATGEDPFLYPNVDWMKLLFNKFGTNRSANANISGGTDMATYYVGLSVYSEDGMYRNDGTMHDYDVNSYYRRYSVTSNINLKPFKTTDIKLGIQGYLANANYPATSNNAIFSSAFNTMPNYIAPFFPDGKIGDKPAGSVQNPYALLNEMGYANQWRSQLYSNLKITQELPWITEGLSISGMFSFDTYNYTSNRFTRSPNCYMPIGRDENGLLQLQQTYTGSQSLSYSNSSSGNINIYMEASINYKRTFDKHDVSAMLLYNQSDEKNTKANSVETALPYRFRGLAGRVAYSYDDRYFIEANFGYNGSENFAPQNRYGFFPSVGLGWVLSNEKFFEDAQEAFQFIKLRATYGKVGNAKITGRRFAYLSTITTSNSNSYVFGKNYESEYTIKKVGEEGVDVSWETANKLNVGIDINTLKNNLSIHADYFRENRSGIFLSRGDIPDYVGLTSAPLGNLGKVDNHGFEVSADYHQQITDDWFFSFMGNFSYSHNTVVENDISYTYPWLDVRGQRVGQRYGFIAEKLFDSDEEVYNSAYQTGDTRAGDIKYKDINGDGKIDSYDKVPIGYGSTPEIIFGFGFNLAWRNLSLSAMFQGSACVDAMIAGQGVTPFYQGMSSGNIMSNITSRWTTTNPSQDVFYPRLSPSSSYNMNYESSTWWIKDTSYLRLKNLQLTYTLPKTWVKAINFTNVSVYLQAVNLLTFTSFKLWDVEQSDGRGDVYPNTRSYSVGINFSF
ncbi:MAG: TonB-dependent receptor [Bacteroidales bacterium]|nr:TonB-dependent receptor [Bacteroidales bacterium]